MRDIEVVITDRGRGRNTFGEVVTAIVCEAAMRGDESSCEGISGPIP